MGQGSCRVPHQHDVTTPDASTTDITLYITNITHPGRLHSVPPALPDGNGILWTTHTSRCLRYGSPEWHGICMLYSAKVQEVLHDDHDRLLSIMMTSFAVL